MPHNFLNIGQVKFEMKRKGQNKMKQKKIFFLMILFAFFAIYITSIYTNYNISVNAVPDVMVVPMGNAIGIRLYSEGVLVIGSTLVEGVDGNTYEPCKSSGIRSGDILLKINDIDIENISNLIKLVNDSNGEEIKITYKKGNKIFNDIIIPKKSLDDGLYKLGLWVRDGTTGIGTLTFYIPENKYYGALGHGISDIDSKVLIELGEGSLNEASVLSVVRGVRTIPGEIRGIINSSYTLGSVTKNNEFGIYGKILNENYLLDNYEAIPIASRMEIKPGKAKILCTIEGSAPKEYEVEIQKIYNLSGKSTKSMIIKVIDQELLAKTGGIVQGMSGSPIIQNGKFIGAITHVFVNDPTKGYAVFADTMIEQVM